MSKNFYDNMAIVNKMRRILDNMPLYTNKKKIIHELMIVIGENKFKSDKVAYNDMVIDRWPIICDKLIKGEFIHKELMA